MSKYKIDLDYAVYDVDISEEDIKSIIEEADGLILKEKNTEPIILAEAYLKKAQCLQKLNKFIESEDPIIKALKIVPDMPEALIRLGNVYDIEEKHDQAVECFKRGLGINNNYAYGFRMLGLAYDNMNDFKNAQTYYKKAMSKKKDYKLAIEEYAFCCIKLEDYDHAIEYFTKLIEIDQHNVQGYIGRGMAYAELKKLNEAISDFTTSIKIKSDTKFYIIVYRSRGEIFKKLKKYDEAIADFSQIIRLRENDPDAYVSRGEIFFWEENYDKALGDFSKAIDLEPTEYVYCYRARTYAKKKDYEKAIIDFTMAENINNSFVGLYKYRAIMYSQMKEYDKAIKDYSKAINIGQDICNYCRRGLEYHNKGEYNKAIDDFSHVIKNKSNCEEVFENRANTYHTIKNFDKAIDDYSKAFNIEQNSCFLCKRSDVFLGKQDMNKAIDDLTGAIKLRPKCNALYSKRGYVYCQLEKYPKAISDFTKAQEIEPDDAGNYYYRAQAFLMQKNYDAALVDTNKVFELCENNIKPKYYFLRGYIFYRMNDLKLSLLDSTKATNIDPNDVEYRRFFVHISHKIFINDIDLYYDFKVEELLNMPHFFIKKIALLKQAGKTTEKYKKLIKSIYSIWGASYSDTDDTYLYQYTSQSVLENIINNQRLRLTPVDYLNDPLEGDVLYTRLSKAVENSPKILQLLKTVKKGNSNSIAFVRSFTLLEDNISMWNSSYAENGSGVAIGIKKEKMYAGFGLEKQISTVPASQEDISYLSDKECEETSGKKKKEIEEGNKNDLLNYVPVSNMGLYEIIYVDNNTNDKPNKMIDDIANCLMNIPDDDLSDASFISLLSELLLSIAHIIKDKAYEHEKEYRLMYIGSIQEDQHHIHSTFNDGIFIETDSFLFKQDDENNIICFGPNVSLVKQEKIAHFMKHKGLFATIKHSDAPFRK